MRIEIICTGDEVLTGKIVNTNFSYISQKLEDVGLSVHVGDDGRRRPREPAAGVPAGRRARRRGHRQRRPRPHRRRPVAGDRGPGRRRRAGAARGVADAHGGVLPPAQPRDAAQQPEAGDAAGHRRDDRQPDRHRLRLRARHRPGALLLHARRAARAAPHARGAGHPAPAGAQRAADGDPPQALPLLRARRVARRLAADRRRGARARRQREARLPRALPAARDQADRARHRHGRRPAQARAGRGGGAQAARQLHPGRGRPDAGGRGAGRAGARGRARWPSSRRSPAARSPRASATCPGAEKVLRRGVVSRDLGEVCAAVGLDGAPPAGELTRETAEAVARAARRGPAPPTRWPC